MKKCAFLILPFVTCFLNGCDNIIKNRVIIIAGQSNAVGCSSLFGLKDYKEKVYQSSKEGYENIVLSSFCDFHSENTDFDRSITQLEAYNAFGPEAGIAYKLSKRSKKENFYLLKTAWGGTTIAKNWLNNGNRAYHYNISIDYLKSKLDEIKNKNITIDSITICWMQGESDAGDGEMSAQYRDNEKALFTYLRNDLEPYCNKIGIVDAFISTIRNNGFDKEVNNAKLSNSKELDNVKIIKTNGESIGALNLTFPEGEKSHYDSKSMYKLGVKFAEKAVELF